MFGLVSWLSYMSALKCPAVHANIGDLCSCLLHLACCCTLSAHLCAVQPSFAHMTIACMNCSANEIIDATKRGNRARFINHACEPNCETQKWVVNGETCVCIFSLREIAAGEELTYNYHLRCCGVKRVRYAPMQHSICEHSPSSGPCAVLETVHRHLALPPDCWLPSLSLQSTLHEGCPAVLLVSPTDALPAVFVANTAAELPFRCQSSNCVQMPMWSFWLHRLSWAGGDDSIRRCHLWGGMHCQPVTLHASSIRACVPVCTHLWRLLLC